MANINTGFKSLSVLGLVMINIIAIDSLRNLPVNAVNGFSIPFFYLAVCLLFMIPSALVTAELATHYPNTGGAYVWVRNAFGDRIGFLAIWLQWIYNVFWYPTILAFVAANIAYLVDPSLANNKTYLVSMVIGLFFLATAVNCFGMRSSGLLSIFSAIIGTIIPMITIIVLAALWIFKHNPIAIDPSLKNWLPNLSSMNNIAFIVVIMFSVFGLEMSATHAEAVKNPERDYPKALLISSCFIVISLVLASLAIAIIVPTHKLSLVSGLDQAFSLFLAAEHLSFLLPFIILAIIIGSFGSIAAWVIGPTKGLMIAADDGSLPKIFRYRNRFQSPVVVLILQAIIVVGLCGLFIFIKSFNTSYWILSDLTAQLAILFYLLFFAAALVLHKKMPRKPGAFRMRSLTRIVICSAGILSCLLALAVGFIPPTSIETTNLWVYETILLVGLIVFAGLPLVIPRQK